MHVHDIPYLITYIVLQNNGMDISYSMLLGRPWLRDVIITHNYGNNIVTIQGNGMVKTIMVIKHLGTKVKQLEVFLCYGH
jgi:hypothetical protein